MRDLSGVSLHRGCQWLDFGAWQGVRMSVKRTTGGRVHIQSQALTGGMPIVLDFSRELAFITHAEKQLLEQMSAQRGATYLLTWDALSYAVMFDWTQDAIKFSPTWGYVISRTPEINTYYGQIKLIAI